MFDRYYSVQINHTALPGGSLTIGGTSAKNSVNVEFSCRVNPAAVSSDGKVKLGGLTTEHINKLQAIRRYEYGKNSAAKNTLSLWVGTRDVGSSDKVTMYLVITGVIIEATPGPNPERSMSFTIQRSTLTSSLVKGDAGDWIYNTPPLEEVKQQDGKISVCDYIKKASEYLRDPDGNPYSVGIASFSPELNKMITEPEPVTTFNDWEAFLKTHGFEAVFSNPDKAVNDDSEVTVNPDGSILVTASPIQPTIVKVYESSVYKAISDNWIEDVSQQNGMIGIPRSIPQGASVDVILRKPIMPGRYVRLKSKMFKALNSENDFHCGNGVYRVMENNIRGSIRGDVWMQTLTLNRGTFKLTKDGKPVK